MMDEFFAAFIQDCYHVEGGERPHVDSGQGYSSRTVEYVAVKEFKDEAEMRHWVEQQEKAIYTKPKYRLVRCTPMEVHATVSIEVEIK